jgi:MFS family permease
MPPSPADRPPRQRLADRLRHFWFNVLGVPLEASQSVAWDMLAGAFSGLYMGMTFPFFTKIARGELDSSQAAISLMVAAPFIGNLFSPLWARQMEGRAKMPFVLGSWLLARALLFFMPLALTGSIFVGLVGGVQLIGTVSTPAYTSLMRDIYPDYARGRLMGYVRVCAQSLMFLATFTAGRLMDNGVSFRVLFVLAGVFGFAAAFAFRMVRPLPSVEHAPPGPPHTDREHSASSFLRETLGILKHNPAYRYFAMSVFIYGLANLMVQPLFALYQVDVLKIRSTEIANLTNATSLCSIAGSFFWGRFMDRKGPAFTVLCSILLITLIPVVYLTTTSVNGLLFASALSGFGFSGIELSYLSSILLYSEPGRTAQYQSLHSLLLGIRGVIAPLLAIPLMQRFGYPAVFIGALLVMLCGAAVQGMAIVASRRRESDDD